MDIEKYKQAAAIHSGSHLVWWRGGAIGAGGAAGAVNDEDDEADSGDEASNNNANASSSSSSFSSSTASAGGADDSSRFTLDRYDARNLIESATALRKFRRFALQHRAIDESGAMPCVNETREPITSTNQTISFQITKYTKDDFPIERFI